MICTSVIPWLSSGLAKNNKIMSTFVLFSRLFDHFESLAFFENGGQTLHQSTMFLVNFSKSSQLREIFQKSTAVLTKK